MEGYIGEKCGVKFKPLSLVMLYRASKGGKLRKRIMPLRDLEEFADMDSYAKHLCQHERHGAYLKLLTHKQLLSLLERAKAGAKSVGDNPVPYFTMNMPSANDGGVLPLQEKNNQAPSNVKAPEVKAHGELLDLSSLPTLGKQPLSGQKASPSPQLDDKSLDELLQDISELADEAPKDAPSLGVTSRRKEADDFHSDFEDDPVAEKEGEDLNRAPDDVVQKRKKEMEVLFEANRVRPGDEGWEYDKEVDFGEGEGDNKLSCGWDDESEVDSDPEF